MVPALDRATLIAAAYLHDIGYEAELAETRFHPLDGARWLRGEGHERLACLVAHHSGASFEAAARGLDDALAEFPEELSSVADALTYCDLTTGAHGEPIRVTTRLHDIERRYGTDSVVAQSLNAARGELHAAVARTEARVAGRL